MVLVVTGVAPLLAVGLLSLYDGFMEILRYRPRAFFPLDGGNTANLAGYFTATSSTTKTGLALTSNNLLSTKITGTTEKVSYSYAIEKSDPQQEFTYCGTAYAIAGTTIILGSPASDGISVILNDDGIFASFRNYYSVNGEKTTSYQLDYNKKFFVVGVHTPLKDSLYVDGELVAETDIPYENNDYVISNSYNLFTGGIDVTSSGLVNDVALFERALTGAEIKAIYDHQNRGTQGNVPGMFQGSQVLLSNVARIPLISLEWSTDADWDRAFQINCITDEDQLLPEQGVDGLSKPAQWITSKTLYNKGAGLVTTTDVNVDYTGKGVGVSLSLDGQTWTSISGSMAVTFDPYKADLYVKVDFAEGVDGAYLDNLRVDLYTSTVVTPTYGGHTLTYTLPVSVLREYPASQLHEKWGARVDMGGSIVVGHTSSTATFEYWFKPTVDTSLYASEVTPGGHYVNGVLVDTNPTLYANQWYLIQNTGAFAAGNITLNARGTYGSFAIYERIITAQEASDIYRTYIGRISDTADDTLTMTISESATPVTIYDNNYATLSGLQ